MARSGAPTLVLDDLDRQILAALQRDGGLSNLELAEKIGLSPSPCSRRVKAMEDAGVIEKQVRAYPECQACWLITGHEADYLLKIIVPDMDHYQAFLLDKITRIDGVTGVHSSFVMRNVVDTTELPLGYV